MRPLSHAVDDGFAPLSATPAILHKPSRTPDCQDVRHFIEQRYRLCYAASIDCDYDHFYVVTDSTGDIVAAVGLRLPVNKYFLETYLDVPVQNLLSHVYNTPINRHSTIELGNFTAAGASPAYALMQHCWQRLTDCGYEYLLITCTRQLRRRFRNLPYRVLANADPARIVNASQWGSYYEQNPQVISGRLQHYDQRFLPMISSLNCSIDNNHTVRYIHEN